jgi:triacylglycerol lipase
MDAYKTHPIILSHGIARFDILGQRVLKIDNNDLFDGMHYFRNIRTHLKSHGFYVHHTNVDWAGGVDRRSRELKRQIEELLADERLGANKVHIVAHSMGGLDARHMLFDNKEDGLHKKVASLTTIATPHHGSPAADAIVGKVGGILDVFHLGDGASDLTTEACRKFNEKVADWERGCGVFFQAYAGRQEFWQIFEPLKLTWPIIYDREGDNDGLVSVKSAKWNDDYFVGPPQDADHFNLCGWWDPAERVTPSKLEREIKALYLGIAEGLAR